MDHKRPDTLPKNWVKTSIGAIYDVIGGGTPSTSIAKYWGGDIPWITSADIDGVREIKVIRYVTQKGIQESTTNKVPNRTLLVVTRVGLGKIAISDKPICFSQDLQGLVQRLDLIFPEYSLFYLSFELQRLKFEGRGTTISGITKKQLKDTGFPLPPYQEQRRIVAKIEKLFFELDKGIESLKTACEQLKVYRQAVLKHTFEGKLTAKWREENKDKLEKPEKLLARIKQEREAHYERQLQEWRIAVKEWEGKGKPGRKPRKPRNPTRTPTFSKDLAVERNELPLGWTWAKTGSIFEVVSGGTPKGLEQTKGGDIPFYKVSDMNTPGNETRMDAAAIYLSEPKINELGLTAYPEGTVIFPKRGGAILTNKKRILGRPSCFDLNTMGVINSIASISNEYLWHWVQFLDLAKIYDGSNVPQINNKNVDPLPFPICSIEEQREIASILEKMLSLVDEMEMDITQELQKADALRQSILKAAFAGQLVPQDTNDEPALVLLDRIKVEKEQASKSREITKRTRKKRIVA